VPSRRFEGLDDRRRSVAEQHKIGYDVLGIHEVQVYGLYPHLCPLRSSKAEIKQGVLW
jgi:hypothetical protein